MPSVTNFKPMLYELFNLSVRQQEIIISMIDEVKSTSNDTALLKKFYKYLESCEDHELALKPLVETIENSAYKEFTDKLTKKQGGR